MNYLWAGMLLVGIVYAALTGNLGAVTDQALISAKEAVSLCLTMAGAMAFWVGLMRIAENGGMLNRAASALGPLIFCFRRFQRSPRHADISQPILSQIFWDLGGRQHRRDCLP